MAPTTIEKQMSVKSMVFQLTESTKPLRMSANVSAVTRAVPTTAGSRAEHRSQFLHALARAGACRSVPHRLAVYAAAQAVISESVSAKMQQSQSVLQKRYGPEREQDVPISYDRTFSATSFCTVRTT